MRQIKRFFKPEMEFLKLCLVLSHVSYSWASECASIAHRLNCTCDPEHNPDSSDFSAKCLNENVILKYDNSRNYFQVKCQRAVSISDTLFEDFLPQDLNIEYIKFEGCTLPETTFPKVLYELNLKKLVIRCKVRPSPQLIWSAVMLQNLYYLEELIIQECPTAVVPEELFLSNPSLKRLFLEKNEIQTLPANLLNNVTQLKTLSLEHNALKSIPETFFKLSGALENVNLQDNYLENISLAEMKTLKSLDLSLNSFINIPEDMFLDNPLLITINLGSNKIVNVTTRPFKTLDKLETLIMSNNGLNISFPTRFLEGLVKLRNLYLSDFYMMKLPPDLLNWTQALEHLELGHNGIEEFPVGFFQHQTNLKMLNLSFNVLTNAISENTFQGLKSLKYLSLRNNKFTTFPDTILKHLSKLTILHLEENFLEELNMAGQSVPFLEELYLTQNRISKWGMSGMPFGDRTMIQIVDLSRNNLTDLNVYMVMYNDLSILDLSFNHFPLVSLPVFFSNNDLTVNLSDCSIQTVNCSMLAEYPRSKYGRNTHYVLERNQLLCDCHQLQFQECLQNKPENFIGRRDLKCRTISNQANEPILNVDPKDFICETAP